MTQRKATVIVDYQIQGQQQAVAAATQVLAATKALDSGINTQSGTLTKAVDSGVLDYKRLADAAQALQTQADAASESLVTPIQKADDAAKTLIRDIGNLGRDIEALPEPDLSAFGEATSGSGGNGLGSLRQGASRATSLLSLSGIGGQAGSVAAGALGLIESFGPAAALAIPLSLGIKAVGEQEEKAATATKQFVGELQTIAQLVSSGATKSDIQSSIDEQERALKIYQTTTDTLKTYSDSVNQINDDYNQGKIGVDEYQKKFSELAQTVKDATNGKIDYTNVVGNFGADLQRRLGGAIAENQPYIDKATDSITANTVALNSEGVAANTAADDLKKFTELQKESADELVKYQVDNANAIVAAQQLTAEDRAEKIRQDLEEQAVIHQQLASGDLLQGAHDKLVIQYQSLQTEVELLTHTSNTYADQLLVEDAAKKALADTEQSILDNLTNQNDARSKIAETEADIAQIRQDAADKAVQLQQDFYAKDDQSTAEAIEKSLQIDEDAAEKRQELAQDDADKRAQIERKANATISNAIYGRNALAAYLAVQQKQQDLADEKKAYDKSSVQLEKARQKQQAQNDEAEQKAYRAHGDAYQKELSNLQASLNKEVSAKQLALAQEQKGLNDLTVAAGLFAQAVAAAQARVSALAGTPVPAPSTGGGSGSVNPNGVGTPMPSNPSIGQTWTDFSGKLWLWNGHGWQPATAVRQLAAGGIGTGLSRVNDGGGVESGYNYRTNQLMMFTDPVRVFSAPQTSRMFSGGMGGSGGLSITIPIHGTQLGKRQIMDYAAEELDRTLTKAGYD